MLPAIFGKDDSMNNLPKVDQQCYSTHNGQYQTMAHALNALLPSHGPVVNGQGINSLLEDFRLAQICYYDLHETGLRYFKKDFTLRFQLSPDNFPANANRQQANFSKLLYKLAEKRMSKFIYQAYHEQKALGSLSRAIPPSLNCKNPI